jgi:hypothetical protein
VSVPLEMIERSWLKNLKVIGIAYRGVICACRHNSCSASCSEGHKEDQMRSRELRAGALSESIVREVEEGAGPCT